MKRVSFVIPVYRNEGSLHPTYQRIIAIFQKELRDYEYEFIFVDDGSDDRSFDELFMLKTQDKRVNIISFSRNFGQVAACIAAFKEAKGDLVVVMSADLQDPPELITQMVDEYEQGNEIVVCQRIGRNDGFVTSTTSKIFYRLMRISNPKIPIGGFDFLLLHRRAVDELNKINERNRFLQGDILWLGFNIKFIPYERQKRLVGKSQWTFAKKIKYFIDGLLSTSYLPIRLISLMGFVIASTGFLYTILIVYMRVMHQTPFAGWAPIMVLILMMGGIIMLMLGIIGEYIWRIYDETRDRPLYIIKSKFFD